MLEKLDEISVIYIKWLLITSLDLKIKFEAMQYLRAFVWISENLNSS